ncbi:MAG: MarR family transcriptional regulator [Candidatus Brocadiia bacterium]
MKEDINKFRDMIIDSAGEMAGSLGLNRVVGQLYALLYISSKPLSLDEMLDALRISKGNVSVNIRVLEEWGAVSKIWIKGDRKDYYQANPDIMGIVISRLKSGLAIRLGKADTIINRSEKYLKLINNNNLDPVARETIQAYKKRLVEIKTQKEKVKNILAIMSVDMVRKLL